jgi:sugar lactone lactonase YvrE
MLGKVPGIPFMKLQTKQMRGIIAGMVLLAGQGLAQSVYTPYSFITIAGNGSINGPFYDPYGVAVDGAGNCYVADTYNNMIRKIAPGAIVTTLAGSTNPGSADGTGSAAEFNLPTGIAADSAGNLYVADFGNRTVRKVTPAGDVTTLPASFNAPWAVAVDSAGNVYVADSGDHTIQQVTPGGVVTLLAGQAGTPGTNDGTGSAAQFNSPTGVAVDGAGNVYVADENNHTIRKVTPSGTVTTLAGLAGKPGSSDGAGSNARFYYPEGLAVDSATNLYVADSLNTSIRKITPAGMVTTLGGAPGTTRGGMYGVVGYAQDGAGYAARFRVPRGVAVDAAGNLYVADDWNCSISLARPMDYTPYTFTTVAGHAWAGDGDGIGRAAQFNQPWGLAVDGAGNVYVTDYNNFTIRKVTPRGVVTTLAGIPGVPARSSAFGYLSGADFADGAGNSARFGVLFIQPFFGDAYFYGPEGIAADNAGNLYVADSPNDTIRKITPAGVVTTIAGLAGSYGALDGTGNAARFDWPEAVAVDGVGNVYVADDAQLIRKVSPGGVVRTLAGMAYTGGSADGTNSTARFNYPQGIAVDSSGIIYVADTSNHTIRKVTPAGVVTTLAGVAGSAGNADGTGSAARFYSPMGLAVDSGGNIYVADANNSMIRKVTPGGVVTTLAGGTNSGFADGTGSGALFDYPTSVAVDTAGNVYVADQYNNSIRKVTPGGVVTTLAGFGGGGYGSADGALATFANPYGVAADDDGNIYVADSDNNTIRRVDPGGITTTLAGLAGSSGTNDGTGTNALFYEPSAIAAGPGGTLYVADTRNSMIRKIAPGGIVTTLAGNGGYSGTNDGTGSDARFYYPYGIAVSGTNLYVADTYNNTIRKVTFDGVVTTLAGLGGTYGTANGTGSDARFSDPYGVAVDSAGNVYVADYDYGLIRKVTPAGVVTTLAGCATCPYYGSMDGIGTNALFGGPWGIAVDKADNIFVSESYSYTSIDYTIRRVTPAGVVTTVGGLPGNWGAADGTGAAAQFGGLYYGFYGYTEGPATLAVDKAGNIYVADPFNDTIRKGSSEMHGLAITSPAPGSGIYGGQFGFIIEGPEGARAVIEASTNLSQWQPILTNTIVAPFDFNDPQSHLFSRRFYRARMQ